MLVDTLIIIILSSHTETSKFICGSRHFPQRFGQCIRPTLVCTQKRAQVALKEASSGMRGTGDLNRGYGAGQGRVFVDLIDIAISRGTPQVKANCLSSASRFRIPYQFSKSVLGLLVNSLHALIHGLLLLFQDLGVCSLLQTLEDLEADRS